MVVGSGGGGSEGGRTIRLEEETVVIGSKPPADLVIADPGISRRHAEVRRAPSGWVLADLGSTNGTFIGAVRVEAVTLADGTVLRVGSTEIAFEAREEGVALDPAPPGERHGAVAVSRPMRELLAAIERFAPTDLSVVLEGETGAGKEVCARALHAASRRARAPLVVVDCGALSESLVESELFGHERGAFTGAVAARAGAFEEADGGTIFLDEIGELLPALQPKLLRAIEAREVRRLGSNKVRRVDVRVVAATNRDLAAEVGAQRFRADLFFRLSEVRLRVPPLRERRDDVLPIASAIAREMDPGASLSPEAIAALEAREWPGNVRELANVVRRAVVAAAGVPVRPEHLGPADLPTLPEDAGPKLSIDLRLPLAEARDRVLADFHRLYLQGLVDRIGSDPRALARHAGVHEKSIFRLLRNAGIKKG